MNKLLTYCLLLVCSPFLPLSAQELRFETYTMKEGLSHPGTFYRESIIQDKEGFLWISTLNGLNRFDGKTFKVFQFDESSDKSLNSNLITGLCEAADGKIWVGSASGINIFDPKQETFDLLRHDPNDPQSLCGDGVNFIRKDQNGNMWVGTQKSGICRYDIKTKTFENFDEFFGHGLVFFQQKNGTIWCGTHDGLHKYLPNSNTFRTIQLPIVPSDSRKQPAGDICELTNGNLLISSTFSAVWEFDPKQLTFNDLSQSFLFQHRKSPACVLCDRKGNAWLGGVGELYKYNPLSGAIRLFQHNVNDPFSLHIPTLVDGYEDKAGSLWFHVIGEGLQVAHTIDNPFQVLGDFGMSQALPLDDQRLLMNTGEGLKMFDIEQGIFVNSGIPSWFDNMRGRSLALSANKEVLYIRNPNTDEIHQFNLRTQESQELPIRGWLKSDQNSRPWIKLNYFDPVQESWIDIRPELETAFPELSSDWRFGDEAYFNDKESIWLRTGQGVLHYNLQTKTGRHYPFYPQDSSIQIEIYSIFPGSNGRFYCYSTNGLSMFDPALEVFVHLQEKDGLLHNQAHAIVEDASGNPWIGSPKGLQKLDLGTREFTNYDINDGLNGTILLQQWPYRDSLGYLYFTITEKLVRFHPDSIRAKDYAPPVHLLDFYLNHQLVESIGKDSLLSNHLRFCESINLTYDQSDFGFSFIMPVFYKADETQYFYQLYPYEEEWQSANSETQIHYTNIDPGSYTFKVKAKTAAGFWSSNEATINIEVSPPWWETSLAYIIYAILILGILYGIYQFNLNRQLAKAEAFRLKELDGLKSRLYTNITHEFRTPLTVIMGVNENIRGHQDERKLIRRNSKNLLRLVNQLLDLSKLDSSKMGLKLIQADIINYLQYLTESFYSMAEEKKIRLLFYPEVKELVMDYDEVKIQHIIYNLLSNALKFSNPGDKVVLHALAAERNGVPHLKLKVRDTGIGISEKDLEHIFDRFYQADDSTTRKAEGTGIGLALTKELVEVMGGSISVSSQLGEGTEFLILLPIQRTTAFQSRETKPDENLDAELVSMSNGENNFVDEAVEFPGGTALESRGTILIIEDNRDVTTYMSNLLKIEYQILTAPNGKLGVEKAFETIPDIIISDVMMPEMDGYEVCRNLKNDQRTSHIPIILLTAKAEAEDRIEGLSVGADAFLTKPFNKKELFIRLEQLIGLRQKLQERYSNLENFSPAEPSLDDIFLQKLKDAVLERLDDPEFGVTDLCRVANLSNMQVNRKLKALTGKTPSRFIRSIRLHKAMELLKTTEFNISEIAYDVGFSDPNYFSRSFSEEFGKPPNVIRN